MYRPLDSNGAGTIMLSAAQSDEAISRRLIILAKAYKDEADEMAPSAQVAAPALSRSAERCPR
jgi:hypothetical protein